MKVIVVEDERLAAERLISLMHECDADIEVIGQFDSVEDTLNFYASGEETDLMMLDIQLADGKSFEIFEKQSIKTPVIFTTAYDQYALQAFKHFSIDYILKPVQRHDLTQALKKFKDIVHKPVIEQPHLVELKNWLDRNGKNYKERLLVKAGTKLRFKSVEDVSYFYAEGKDSYLVSKSDTRRHLIDYTLEDLERQLDPHRFFRINRKFILQVDAIAEVKGLINRTMEVRLHQPTEHVLTVSREKTHEFREWLDR